MSSKKEATLLGTATAAPEPQLSEGDTVRSRQEHEVKRILAAWRSMSSALQQHSLCEDPQAPGLAQSFLASQRKSSQARKLWPR